MLHDQLTLYIHFQICSFFFLLLQFGFEVHYILHLLRDINKPVCLFLKVFLHEHEHVFTFHKKCNLLKKLFRLEKCLATNLVSRADTFLFCVAAAVVVVAIFDFSSTNVV